MAMSGNPFAPCEIPLKLGGGIILQKWLDSYMAKDKIP
jgi:hypothetical protein